MQALTSYKQTSKQTKRAVIKLNCASKTNLLTLKWIKAHVGHIGNERANEAAKMGTLDASLEMRNLPALSQKSQNNLKARFMQSWQERWLNRTNCKQTNNGLLQYSTKTAFVSRINLVQIGSNLASMCN